MLKVLVSLEKKETEDSFGSRFEVSKFEIIVFLFLFFDKIYWIEKLEKKAEIPWRLTNLGKIYGTDEMRIVYIFFRIFGCFTDRLETKNLASVFEIVG